MVDLHSKTKLLSKLYTLFSTDKADQISGKQLELDIRAIMDRERNPTLQELRVPEYLVCVISGEVMSDPVTLESGRTYDRASISQLFGQCKSEGQQCYCPVTMMEVDSDILIPNFGLKKEVDRLFDENAWAFEFNPRQKFKSIKIWDQFYPSK